MNDLFISEAESLERWEATAETMAGFVPVPGFYQPLFQACHQVVSGELAAEQWEAVRRQVLDQAEQLVYSIEQRAAALDTVSPAAQACMQELDLAFDGVFSALAEMGDYLDQSQPEILDRGWMNLMAATAEVQAASQELALVTHQDQR